MTSSRSESDPALRALAEALAEWDAMPEGRTATGSAIVAILIAGKMADAIRAALAAAEAAPLDVERLAVDDLTAAAVFMLDLVDQYYGTDHEFDIPEEAEFRYYRAVIVAALRSPDTETKP
jgi:hypothetical protein